MRGQVEWLATAAVWHTDLDLSSDTSLTWVSVVFGPAATQWYKVLTKIQLQNRYITTAARVLTDQCIFATLNLGLFLSSMAYLEGANPRQRLQDKYAEALKKNWMLWPPVQTINFTLVPLEHRVLVVNVVSLGWNCYLSWVNSQGGKSGEAKEVERQKEK